MTLNSHNTKLKNDGVYWGSLHIQIVLHVSFKKNVLCFLKMLEIQGEINKLGFDAYDFTTLVKYICL